MNNQYNYKKILNLVIIGFVLFTMTFSTTANNLINIEKLIIKDQNRENILCTTIYVDDDNTQGPWNGTLQYPYQFIQDAINAAENGYEIYVFNGTYKENIVILKSLTITGEHKDITIIDGSNIGNVVTITSDNIILSGFLIRNSGNNPNNAGLSIHSKYNQIKKNNIFNNNIGILFGQDQNQITLNNFINNNIDAYDTYSNIIKYNFWDKYNGEDDNENGIGDTAYNITGDNNKDWYPLIHIYGSIQNLDTKDIFFTIQNAIDDENTECKHTIYVKPDTYNEHIIITKTIKLIGEDKEDTIIDGRESGNVISVYDENSINLNGFTIKNSGNEYINAGIIITSDDNIIKNNIIENNFHGIYIKQSSDDNIISNNKIINNNWNGIYVLSTCSINDGTIIFENTIENNDYAGIAMVDSSYNYIYHNDFIGNLLNAYDNSNNIWDDGYPSGGNYWDDYTGEDTNGDGIGEIPYEISNGINKDRYPFIKPFGTGDNIGPEVQVISPQNGLYLRNIRLFSNILRQRTIIFGAVKVEVEATDFSGIERVLFYIDGNPDPEAIITEEPYIWEWRGGSLIRSLYTIHVVAYDYEGNPGSHSIIARKFI